MTEKTITNHRWPTYLIRTAMIALGITCFGLIVYDVIEIWSFNNTPPINSLTPRHTILERAWDAITGNSNLDPHGDFKIHPIYTSTPTTVNNG